ncbi:MAG: flagellar basal body L-ring protein FlgH [Spirochaetales bacterium]|jgi:flagellar L-ring protein precursor FlgH|nr:flagellar basal body L-ring protein FlgH [Spirochaetales bacterium]
MKSNNNNYSTTRLLDHSTTRSLNIVLMGILFLFVIAGCSSSINMVKKDEPVPVPKEEISLPPTGSIWPGENAKNSLFTDNKARHVDDIITIVIDEYSSGSNSADTTTSRDTSTTAGLTSLLGLAKEAQEKNTRLGSSIRLGGTSSNSLKGKGETTRDGTLEAKITARVVRVLHNGNLAIEGKRRLAINAEDQYIVVSGIIRPEDITSDNIISSQYIADAKIVYTGSGVINDKMRPGWLTRVVDWAWPF